MLKAGDRMVCLPDEDINCTYGWVHRDVHKGSRGGNNFYECLLISEDGCQFYDFVIEKFMRKPDIIEELLYF